MLSAIFRRAAIAGRVNTEERMAAVVEPIEDKDAENKKETKLDQKTKEEGFQISDSIETIDRCT